MFTGRSGLTRVVFGVLASERKSWNLSFQGLKVRIGAERYIVGMGVS